MVFFFSDKEKHRYRDDVFHNRQCWVKLYQITETMAVAVVSENGGVNQKQSESNHHKNGEPPDLSEIKLQNKTYSKQ